MQHPSGHKMDDMQAAAPEPAAATAAEGKAMQHGAGHSMGDMPAAHGGTPPEPGLMMSMHHAMARWVDLVLIGLGIWLLLAPATLGYPDDALTWSDMASGAILIVLALASFYGRQWWAPYASTLVGTWLILAPLVFWAPDAASYANDTLVGALIIGFALLIPHGMDMGGPQIPAGWNYNPSTWQQRMPIIGLGIAGFLLSRYMGAYQLGHIDSVWDPFFGTGTERVLDSDVSRMFPVSDSGLGAAVYLLEVLMVIMGDPRRWRTMPWMVAFFAILVLPLGVTSIMLVILQPLAVGDWCTLCLIAAMAMLVMVPLTLDEVVAMGQLIVRRRREGASIWRVFWLGSDQPEGEEVEPARRTDSSSVGSMLWGVTLPWTLVVAAVLGGWLLLAPAVLGYDDGLAADGDRLMGALVLTVAMIALAEVARPIRFVNVAFGAWLVVQPWLLGDLTFSSAANDALVGVGLVLLSLPRGPVRERYGDWQAFIR